jgi:serine/threonine protein kinase
MPYCDQGDLDDYLRKNRSMEESEMIHLSIQIVDAIAYCHKMKIIHRDLKPENIFKIKNSLKIGDFGLSKKVKSSNFIPHLF